MSFDGGQIRSLGYIRNRRCNTNENSIYIRMEVLPEVLLVKVIVNIISLPMAETKYAYLTVTYIYITHLSRERIPT